MCFVKSSCICETQLSPRLGHSGVTPEMPTPFLSHLHNKKEGLGDLWSNNNNNNNDSTKSGGGKVPSSCTELLSSCSPED